MKRRFSRHEKVSLAAYYAWEKNGRPEGQDDRFWRYAEYRFRMRENSITRCKILNVIDVLKTIIPFEEGEEERQLKPVDQIYAPWISPFNELVAMENRLEMFEDVGPFKAAFLKTIFHLSEGSWIDNCGLPKHIGLTIQLANPPVGKDPISQVRSKFRQSWYGKVGDNRGMAAESDRYLHIFMEMAVNAEKQKAEGISESDWQAWDKNKWVIMGRHLIARKSLDDCVIKRRSMWRDYKRQKIVAVYNLVTPERTFAFTQSGTMSRNDRRLEIFINTHFAAKQFKMSQESRALDKLKSMITEEQYEQYTIAGVFEETSEKSGVTYYLRRLKPTLAFRNKQLNGKSGTELLAGLCLHPLAYYLSSFSGCLCPTDDVVSHLLWIRGDEHGFWAKANHHELNEVEIGL